MNNTKDDCPSLMSDGRIFTDYRTGRYRSGSIENMNSNELRRYLQRHGKEVLASNRQQFFGQLCQSCENCSSCRSKQVQPAEEFQQ